MGDCPQDARVRERARQASVDAYALGYVEHSAPTVDVDLTRYALLAQELTGSVHAAIDILDQDCQVTLATASGAIPVTVDRSLSICSRILYDTSDAGVFVAADASKDAELWNHPMVSGANGSVRFYAGATLTGREGLPLGMLSVDSDHAVSEEVAERAGAMLQSLGQAVVSTLEARRVARDLYRPVLSSSVRSAMSAMEESRSQPVRRGEAINAVIDDGTIRTIFQPIVHLRTGQVVGFEALSRGPEGTELESPMAMLAAANEVGRLGELDWLCRTSAMHAASCSGLSSNLSWFINVEPAGLEIECPKQLRPVLDRARSRLRVVLEVVEREVEGHVTRLLRATEQARKDAWGVALDDVGAEVGSLALLPFFQPDVVKLDMSLVRSAPSDEAAEITAAVRAYAEGRKAVILAEGIETKEHERLAKVFGATYGQGYLYGHPGPLPASVPAPTEPIPLRQHPYILAGATPFEALNSSIESQRAVLGDLSHILTHLGRHCAEADDAGVLLTMLASEGHYQRRRQMIDVFAEHNAFTVVLIREGGTEVASPRFHVASLHASSRMNNEILMIVVTPHYAGALVLRGITDFADSELRTASERPFDYIYTHDRSAVITAARAFLEHMSTEMPVEAAQAEASDTQSTRRRRRRTVAPPEPIPQATARRPSTPEGAPDALLALHAATRSLLDAVSPGEVVEVTTRLVRDLGGEVVPTRLAGKDALPLDLSFGVEEPLVPFTRDTGVARLHLETLLPPFLEDARRVVMELRQATQLRREATRDALTGLLSRRTLDRQLHQLQVGDAIAMIDFDHFKNLNDVSGHAAGDAVLTAFGQLLRECLRSTDIAGRYGGEEIIVAALDLSPHLLFDRLEQVRLEWERIRPYPVTFSAGVAGVTTTAAQALAAADGALYMAKNHGRNLVIVTP